MSSIESASMPGTEVSEKSAVDFGTKAVSLKTQSDSGRLLQGSSQIRNAPSQGTIRSTLGTNTTHSAVPVLSNISSQKTGNYRGIVPHFILESKFFKIVCMIFM